MSKRKILVFIDWFYPAYKAGGPVQSCLNVIEKLGNDFDFKVVTGNKEYRETEPLKGITPDTWIRHENGLQVYYLSTPSPFAIKKILEEEKPDAIWLNSMFSKFFSILPMRLWKGRMILSPRGMLAPEALKLKSFKKHLFLKVSALLAWHKNVIFHATSEAEKKQIMQFFPANTILIAPNLPTTTGPVSDRQDKLPGTLRLVSLARIAPEKNIDRAVELLNLFSKRLQPGQTILFDHFGSTYDEVYEKECKNACKDLPETIQINFKGSLTPGMVHATLQQYDFLFFPTRGENYGHAIVQAWAAGLPVLISNATPWRGLEGDKLGWDISNQNTAEWMKVLKKCLEMGPEEHFLFSQSAIQKATMLSSDPETLVLIKNLFRE